MKDDVRKTTNIVDILSDGSRKIVSRPAVLFFYRWGQWSESGDFSGINNTCKKMGGGGVGGGGGGVGVESIHGRAWGA